ncbi:uncharacterized protein TNIN_322021 [Trichonephila inaurata madagascariensis]|uniref:Uncharacterized protein n=1 Tax=Trichonephila inaurata madagascariensis TaxID=2747483 RepID=A0A8X6WRC5_9ARAC|nr:uncharacterized protein TNIN_322021 [Trichonephila inaurata madagascariensis]
MQTTSCAGLEVTKADIRRFTLIVQGYDNMIASLKHSKAQDEHDPTFVEMIKQRAHYENRLEKAVSEFGNLPYCDTPGCPIHETPTASPVKTLPNKRKDERMASPLLLQVKPLKIMSLTRKILN